MKTANNDGQISSVSVKIGGKPSFKEAFYIVLREFEKMERTPEVEKALEALRKVRHHFQ